MDKKRLRDGDIEDQSGMREAWRLALRNLMLLRARTVVPLLVIALLAGALDVFAGCQRVLMEKQEAEAAFASARASEKKWPVSVIEAKYLSEGYRAARRRVNAELGGAGLAGLALAAAMSCWAAAANGRRRRRELTVLRSFGLQRRGITAHVMAEAIVVAAGAVVLALIVGTVAAWLADALGLRLPVELDPVRLAGTMAALLAVTIAAAAIPALRAADPE